MGRPESAPLPTGFKFVGLDALFGKGKSKATEPREFVRPAKVSRTERLVSAAKQSEPPDVSVRSIGSNEASGSGAGSSSDPIAAGGTSVATGTTGDGAGPSCMPCQQSTQGSGNDDSNVPDVTDLTDATGLTADTDLEEDEPAEGT